MPRKKLTPAEMRQEREYLLESDPEMTVAAYGPGRTRHDTAQVRYGDVGGKEEIYITPEASSPAARFAALLHKTTHYRHTDAWRGVFDTPAEAGNFVKVLDTWVSPMGHSGDWETQHQVPIEEIITKWKDENQQPPVPVFVVYTPTSNVFSVGFDMYVRKGDRESFMRYLQEANVDEKDLRRE